MIKNLENLRAAIQRDPQLVALIENVCRRQAKGIGKDPSHDISHFERVALWTWRIVGDNISFRNIIAAAYLHDIVNTPKNSPERHLASLKSAELAKKILSQYDFQSHDIEDIYIAIRDHSFSRGAKPKEPLAQALQDADRLESVGVISIFRTIATGVKMGADFFNVDDPWAQQRELDDLKYSVDHFFTKLLKLPEQFNTEEGRKEAYKRRQIMISFLCELGQELESPLPNID